MHAKACEREIGGQLSQVDTAAVEREHVRAIANGAYLAADEFVQLDRLLEAATAMKELQAKRALRLRPERVIVPKADRLILVLAQIAQEWRREFFGRTVSRGRQRTRPPFQRCVIERSSTAGQIGARERREHDRGLQEVASSHEGA
jgi:hypothetical protein